MEAARIGLPIQRPIRAASKSAGGVILLPGWRGSVEEMFDGERGGAEPDGVGAQVAKFDRSPGERMAQRMLAGGLADSGQHPLPEQQPGPAAEDDPPWIDQVDQIGDADAEVQGRLI